MNEKPADLRALSVLPRRIPSTRWLGALLFALSGASVAGCGGRAIEEPTASGACLDPATTCGSTCVDLAHDPDNCGACSHVCGLGEVCNGGLCSFACLGGSTACGSACVDLGHDPDNCGACGNACGADQVCADGQCGLVCLGGTQKCGGACADTDVDPANCGACGVACGVQEGCIGGTCTTLCDGATILCAAECVDPASDPANCGACGVACSGGKVCSGGQCVVSCDVGLTICDGACVNLASDEANCGACSVACGPSGVCSGGACVCAPGQVSCSGGCVDTMADPANCGACGVACGPLQTCLGGSCGVALSTWPTLGGDERHSGKNALETGKPPATLAWSIGAGKPPLNPVVIDGTRVFVTSRNAGFSTSPLLALSLADGTQLWSHDFGDVFSVGQPSVASGKVYVQHCNHGNDTKLWQLDAATGNVDWAAPHFAQWEHYWAPLVVDDTVYVNGGSYGGLYGFSKTTANQLFQSTSLEQYDEWSPAYFNGSIFTFVEGNLRAHSPQTGALQWTTEVTWNWAGWSMMTAPVFSDTMAYVIAPPSLFAISPSTKAIVWSANGSYSSMPAVADGAVYALSGGTLAVRDAATGAPLWNFPGDSKLKFPPVVAAGYVYVASVDNVYAIDIATHAQVWTDAFGGWIAVASGRLVVARANGTLAAYNLSF